MVIMRLIILLFFAFKNHFSTSLHHNSRNDKDLHAIVKDKGISKLAYLGDEMKKHVDWLVNVSQILINVTESYTTELDRLFEVMEKHEVKYELERQLYYLYIVESCNEIFLSKSIMLLDTISALVNNDYELDTNNIIKMAEIETTAIDEKKSNMMHICFRLEVCRSFPAFSNHLANLLNEINKLPNSKFSNIIKLLEEVLGVKLRFIRNIMNDGIAFQITNTLKRISEHPKDMRRFFKVLGEIMTKKNKLFKTKDGTIRTRTKTVRLLIDIVDKAFEAIGEEAIYIDFDNIIKSIKLWAKGEKSDMKEILTNSCNYIFDILNFYWDSDTKKEVKLLIEVYMTGTTSENSILYDDLLYKGSKYLKNENFRPYFDII